MNIRKVCIIQIVLFLSMMMFSSASAEEMTDTTNDIWYLEKDTTNLWVFKENNLSNYSYIDVTNIQYGTEEDFEIIINFLEPFNVSKIITIEIFYGNYDNQNQYYRFRYTTETNMIQMSSIGISSSVNRYLGIDFSENQTQMRFNTTLTLDDDGFSIWGYTNEYSSDYDKYWADFFPSSFEPTDEDLDDSTQDNQDQDDDVNDSDDDQQQNDTDTNGGQNTDNDETTDDTPGFEMVLFCASIMIIILFGYKRKI